MHSLWPKTTGVQQLGLAGAQAMHALAAITIQLPFDARLEGVEQIAGLFCFFLRLPCGLLKWAAFPLDVVFGRLFLWGSATALACCH